jgi:hypothetical protein
MVPQGHYPPGVPHGMHHGGGYGVPSHGSHGGGMGGQKPMPHKIVNPHCKKCHGTGWNSYKGK